MNKLHYFMVGMPSAGKTSFVVRLCSQLLMNEGTLMYRLSDGELPEQKHRWWNCSRFYCIL